MLISASLPVVLVTETVALEFSAMDFVAGEAVTESITDKADGEEVAEAAVLASWCRAARCLFLSLAAGPRWRGRWWPEQEWGRVWDHLTSQGPH